VEDSDVERDCGWVDVLHPDEKRSLARGRLVIVESPGQDQHPGEERVAAAPVMQLSVTNPTEKSPIEWSGRIESLRVETDLDPGAEYRIRFETNGETRAIRLDGVDGERAAVTSADGQLPAVWVELGGH
jgi:hypothetical protein